MLETLVELWRFMQARRKFWLAPVLVMLTLFGGLILLTQGSPLAPFIYSLF
jgi:hypothetical protein